MIGRLRPPFVIFGIYLRSRQVGKDGAEIAGLFLDQLADFPMMSEGIDDSS